MMVDPAFLWGCMLGQSGIKMRITTRKRNDDNLTVIKHRSNGASLPTLIGAAIAAYCSWQLNHSIMWAAIHAFFNWFYLLYLCAGCGGGFPQNIPW